MSIYCAAERALLYGELTKIKKRMGDEGFPFIHANLVPNLNSTRPRQPPKYPVVVKVGSSCAGYGKMKIDDAGQLNELRGCLMMHKE